MERGTALQGAVGCSSVGLPCTAVLQPAVCAPPCFKPACLPALCRTSQDGIIRRHLAEWMKRPEFREMRDDVRCASAGKRAVHTAATALFGINSLCGALKLLVCLAGPHAAPTTPCPTWPALPLLPHPAACWSGT